MQPSIHGGFLPESPADFEQLRQQNGLLTLVCGECKARLSPANTRSAAGWRESQISGMCENCFDELFAERPDGTIKATPAQQIQTAASRTRRPPFPPEPKPKENE